MNKFKEKLFTKMHVKKITFVNSTKDDILFLVYKGKGKKQSVHEFCLTPSGLYTKSYDEHLNGKVKKHIIDIKYLYLKEKENKNEK